MRLLGSALHLIDLRDRSSDEPQVVASSPRRPPGPASRRRARHLLAALLGAGMLAIPLAAAAIVALVAPHIIEAPGGALVGVWWVAVFLTSAAAAWGTDHLARRYLPLVGLFRLSLVFPADVGSRLGLAMRAGNVRDLERGVIDLRDGDDVDHADAAATIIAYASALQKHSRFTRGHCERVRAYSELIAAELGIPKADRDLLRWAALLHDIGKLHVPSELLDKPGALDDDEWRHMRGHAEVGLCMAEPMRAWLGDWVDAIGQHHERYDGRGYPQGLAGENISLAARIVTVADSYETMTATRPYKKPMPQREARAELVAQAGKQFDPVVVRAMLNLSVRRLRWAAGPIAGLGDAMVVAVIAQLEPAGALAGVSSTVGGWAPALSGVSPLRVGAAATAVLAATMVAPGYDTTPTSAHHPPAAVSSSSAPEPTPPPTYGAAGGSVNVFDPLVPFGRAQAGRGAAPGKAVAGAKSHGVGAGHDDAATSTGVSTPTRALPDTAKSPVLTAPATPAVPHVSRAVPAAPTGHDHADAPTATTATTEKPDKDHG